MTLRIKIIVQGRSQSAEDFSSQLNVFIGELCATKTVMPESFVVQFTTASDGRQTANITYRSKF